jgi:hypothetical protein
MLWLRQDLISSTDFCCRCCVFGMGLSLALVYEGDVIRRFVSYVIRDMGVTNFIRDT